MHHTQFITKMSRLKKIVRKFVVRMFLWLTGIDFFVYVNKIKEILDREKEEKEKNERERT